MKEQQNLPLKKKSLTQNTLSNFKITSSSFELRIKL